jgi:CRP-like cAMP-binding protein
MNLHTLEITAAIIDSVSAERAIAKMCVWSTARFSKYSEAAVDSMLATGQRMEAERDVYLVREGEEVSCFLFYVASGQIKFSR